MIRTAALSLLLAAAACKGKKKEDAPAPAKTTEPAPTTPPATTPPATTPPATPAAAGTLVLGDAKLSAVDKGKTEELALDKTGKVTSDGKQVGEVTTAGELKVDGKVVATIAADGKVTIVGEPQEMLTIREDGALLDKDGKVALEIADDGTVKGPLTAETNKITVTGDKAARRALMLAFLGVEKK